MKKDLTRYDRLKGRLATQVCIIKPQVQDQTLFQDKEMSKMFTSKHVLLEIFSTSYRKAVKCSLFARLRLTP